MLEGPGRSVGGTSKDARRTWKARGRDLRGSWKDLEGQWEGPMYSSRYPVHMVWEPYCTGPSLKRVKVLSSVGAGTYSPGRVLLWWQPGSVQHCRIGPR
jgi:hypothetical protein